MAVSTDKAMQAMGLQVPDYGSDDFYVVREFKVELGLPGYGQGGSGPAPEPITEGQIFPSGKPVV